jgi:DME family drug/metabolite transporter
MAAALAGLALVSLTAGHLPDAGEGRPVLGLVLAVASAATYAATTLLGHGLAQRVDPVALTTCATAAGAAALSPVLVLAAAQHHLLPTADPVSLLLLGYHGGALALAYLLLYAGLRTVSGSAATVATLVEPVSAAVLAVVLLGERLPWPAVAGSVLVLAAVAALREPAAA